MDEPESPGLPGKAIPHYRYAVNVDTGTFEESLHVVFIRGVRQVPYEQAD